MISENQLQILRSKGIEAKGCSKGQANLILKTLEKNGNDVNSEEVKAAIKKYGASLIE